MFALGATLGGAAFSGCPVYGGPPEDRPDGSTEPPRDAGDPAEDAGGPAPAYGAAPIDGG